MAFILLSPMWIVVPPTNLQLWPSSHSVFLENMLLEYIWMNELWCTDYEWVFVFVLLMMILRWECHICFATHCTHRMNDDSLAHSQSYSLCNRCTFNILLSSQFHSSTNYSAINYNSLLDKCCTRIQFSEKSLQRTMVFKFKIVRKILIIS